MLRKADKEVHSGRNGYLYVEQEGMTMNRHLDGVYFRVERDEKWESICFSDLTEEERTQLMKRMNREFLEGLCNILADTIKELGDTFDIIRGRD